MSRGNRISRSAAVPGVTGKHPAGPALDHPPPDRLRTGSRLLFTLPLILMLGGRFLGGPSFWGINHLAYLPGAVTVGWIAAALLAFLPPVQGVLTRALGSGLSRWFFHGRLGPLLAILSAGVAFYLLSVRTYFLGDGYLMLQLLERGVPFRTFDSMDYVLHFQAFQSWCEPGSAAVVYRCSAIIAGMMAVGMILSLARRLDWEPWRRVLLLGFFLFSGPVLLFCGYVESYAFLFVFLTGFLVTGTLVLGGRAPLWLASVFFGLALFFHLTAVFAGPALLFLVLKAPSGSAGRRWVEAAAPLAGLMGLAVVLHLATGYDRMWWQEEFIQSPNTRNLWVHAGGTWGLFSRNHLLLQMNLLMITAPVCLMVVLARFRDLRRLKAEPAMQFLALQVGTVAILSLAIDRKLGGARDWDLLAGHSAGLMVLAALLISPLSTRSPACPPGKAESPRPHGPPPQAAAILLTAAFFCTLPWILLGRSQTASVSRFTDVAAGFAPQVRAYAFEDLGNFYTTEDDPARAAAMLERSLASDPDNARRHILLGSAYQRLADVPGTAATARRDYLKRAEESLRESLRRKADSLPALENLGRLLMQRQDFRAASDLFARAVTLAPDRAEAWEGLGFCRLDAEDFTGAVEAFRKTLDLHGADRVRGPLGVALTRLRRYPEARAVLQDAVQRGAGSPLIMTAYMDCLVSWVEEEFAAHRPVDQALLGEAEGLLDVLLKRQPMALDLITFQRRIAAVRAGSAVR